MPYTIRFLHEHRLAVLTFTGTATGETFAEALEHLFGHSEWQPGYDRIWHELGITELAVSYPEVQKYQRLASELSQWAGAGRSAIVASEATHYSLSRLYQAVLPWEVKVVRTVPEALAWLGKPLDIE